MQGNCWIGLGVQISVLLDGILVPGTVSSSIFQTFGSKAHAAANYHRHPAGSCWETLTKKHKWRVWWGWLKDMLKFGRL